MTILESLELLDAFVAAVDAHPALHVRCDRGRGATEGQLAAFEKRHKRAIPGDLRAVFERGRLHVSLATDAAFEERWGDLQLGGLSDVRGLQTRMRQDLKYDVHSDFWLRAIEDEFGVPVGAADPFLVADSRDGRVTRRSLQPHYRSEWVADSLAQLIAHWIAAGGFTGRRAATQAEFDAWWSQVQGCVPISVPFVENRWLRHLSRFYEDSDLLGLPAEAQLVERIHGYLPPAPTAPLRVPDAVSANLRARPHDAEVWSVIADWCETTTGARRAAPAVQTAWAERVERDAIGTLAVLRLGGVPHRFRWIPPGCFEMGSPTSERGRGHAEYRHTVELTQGFWLGEAPVTQLQWLAVMGTRSDPAALRDQAADHVSWHDAQAFIDAANAQTAMTLALPSEAQWEYACRAGTRTPRYAKALKKIAWYDANYNHITRLVKTRQPNAWGLFDTLGLVNEWCADWFDMAPPAATVVDPTGPMQGTSRVVRGGCYWSAADSLRAAARTEAGPDRRASGRGFRLKAVLA